MGSGRPVRVLLQQKRITLTAKEKTISPVLQNKTQRYRFQHFILENGKLSA
jgi:hypothetical protein